MAHILESVSSENRGRLVNKAHNVFCISVYADPEHRPQILLIAGTSRVFLALLAGLTARAIGARVTVAALLVTFRGTLATGLTQAPGCCWKGSLKDFALGCETTQTWFRY
jgi:hypothetical protein